MGHDWSGAAATRSSAPGEWTPDQLVDLDLAEELEIATPRRDGAWRPWVPIWVARVDTGAYVRTWHRRSTGWFGSAVTIRHARIRTPRLAADVGIVDISIVDVGNTDAVLRHDIDDAYRAKYRNHPTAAVDRMTADEATAATLHLLPSTG